MSFRNGAYATLWEHKDGKGNYHDGRISTSKKYNDTYEEDFSSWVRFIGEAKTKCERLKNERQRIRIISCEVTNRYDKEAKKEYVNFAIFDFELADDNNKKDNKDKPKSNKQTKSDSSEKTNTDNKNANNQINFSPEQIQMLGNILNLVTQNNN